MHTIEHAVRLLETAGLGVFVAAVAAAAALVVVLFLVTLGRIRVLSACLILGTACLVSTGIVHTSYSAWYRHRCVDHHSDIAECDA